MNGIGKVEPSPIARICEANSGEMPGIESKYVSSSFNEAPVLRTTGATDCTTTIIVPPLGFRLRCRPQLCTTTGPIEAVTVAPSRCAGIAGKGLLRCAAAARAFAALNRNDCCIRWLTVKSGASCSSVGTSAGTNGRNPTLCAAAWREATGISLVPVECVTVPKSARLGSK